MNDRKSKLHLPLALMATTPRSAAPTLRLPPHELRQLVAAMVD